MASEGRFDGKSESLPRLIVTTGAGDAPSASDSSRLAAASILSLTSHYLVRENQAVFM